MNRILLTCLLVIIHSYAQANTQPITCFGTEPFWNMQIHQEMIKFSQEDTQLSYSISPPQTAYGMQESFTKKWIIDLNQENNGAAYIVKHNCSDNMSDTIYPYEVILDLGQDKFYYGCCR